MRGLSTMALALLGSALSATAHAEGEMQAQMSAVGGGGSCLVGVSMAAAQSAGSPLGGSLDEGEAVAMAVNDTAAAASAATTTAEQKPVVASGGECLRGVAMAAAQSATVALAGDLNESADGSEKTAEADALTAMAEAGTEASSAPAKSKPKPVAVAKLADAQPAPHKAKASGAPRKLAVAGKGAAPKISEVFKPWWPKAAEGKLNLAYAGPAAFDSAIVLLFDKSFESAELSNAEIQVLDGAGKPVKSQWVLASGNKKMLTAKVPEGRYLVKVGPKLSSMDGSVVVGGFAGPVIVGMK